MDETALARIEAQRVELEANIIKLKKSLRHWQALEIDYRGLSEEFVARPENWSKEQSLKIAQEYGADLVKEKELRELLNYDKGTPRKPKQIVELLSKRIEYVNRNVDTIKKQLSDAQKKLNVLLLAEQPEFREDAGLPLSEITEELDEDGNVISSKVQRSDQASAQLTDVLKKAGVGDLEQVGGKIVAKTPKLDPARDASLTSLSSRNSTAAPDELNQPPAVSLSPLTATKEVVKTPKSPSVPEESAEEAALRTEMLQYHEGLGEIGAIVAELDLEEGDISYGEDDDDLSIDSDYDEDEDLADESDDESGMSRSSLQSEAYLRKMKLLEKKHGVTGMSNIGPKSDMPNDIGKQTDRPTPAEAARKAALARAETVASSEDHTKVVQEKSTKPKAKKKVTFASALDIATAEEPVAESREIINGPITITTRPFKQSVVERPSEQLLGIDTESPQMQKVSRFKAARRSTPQTPLFAPGSLNTTNTTTTTNSDDNHFGPVGKIYEPNIIEHQNPSPLAAAPPIDSHDFGINDAMHQREIASEYYQLRNRMIQRQGGYVAEGEQDNWGDATAPLDVEGGDGKVRKVSRFKAARMK